jgi:hypothetical protein
MAWLKVNLTAQFLGHLAIQLLGHLVLACKLATTHELVKYGKLESQYISEVRNEWQTDKTTFLSWIYMSHVTERCQRPWTHLFVCRRHVSLLRYLRLPVQNEILEHFSHEKPLAREMTREKTRVLDSLHEARDRSCLSACFVSKNTQWISVKSSISGLQQNLWVGL